MQKIGAYVAIGALAAIVCSPSPATAFHLGPFHFGFPFFGHRHHYYHPHPLYMRAPPSEARARPNDLARPEPAAGVTSALLYPSLALPAIVENIFFPAYSSPWPFGYQAIFTTAFAKTTGEARQCQPAIDPNATVARISGEIAPTADQSELLQKLGGALGAASGYLAKACPQEIPAQPVARLQLMESQIQQLAMALDIVRQPLQDFEQSLNPDQQARFAAVASPQGASNRRAQIGGIATGCGGSPTPINWSLDQINRSVQPTDAQREALDDVKQAFGKAASDLEAHCPTAVPPTALSRLETIESRLDSTWRAVLSIQVALANFETKLSDRQKDRFDTMNFAAR